MLILCKRNVFILKLRLITFLDYQHKINWLGGGLCIITVILKEAADVATQYKQTMVHHGEEYSLSS